jgi:hypothetical protein
MEASRSVATSSVPGRDDHSGLIVSRRRRVGMAHDWLGFERVLNEGVVAFSDGAPPQGRSPSPLSLMISRRMRGRTTVGQASAPLQI